MFYTKKELNNFSNIFFMYMNQHNRHNQQPTADELDRFSADYTIIDLPSFRADPERHGCRSETVIAIDFMNKLILIGGTGYAGEMKKAVFTVLNYVLMSE